MAAGIFAYPAARGTVTWSARAQALTPTKPADITAGVFGANDNWGFVAAATGDVDNAPGDNADYWVISSEDGTYTAGCPAGVPAINVSGGESVNMSNDVTCE